MMQAWDITASSDFETQEVLRHLDFLEAMITASSDDINMRQVFEDKAAKARADLMVSMYCTAVKRPEMTEIFADFYAAGREAFISGALDAGT